MAAMFSPFLGPLLGVALDAKRTVEVPLCGHVSCQFLNLISSAMMKVWIIPTMNIAWYQRGLLDVACKMQEKRFRAQTSMVQPRSQRVQPIFSVGSLFTFTFTQFDRVTRGVGFIDGFLV